jgi:hypothetical protein
MAAKSSHTVRVEGACRDRSRVIPVPEAMFVVMFLPGLILILALRFRIPAKFVRLFTVSRRMRRCPCSPTDGNHGERIDR